MEHGSDQFCQVQPDVGDVYRHVISHLQDFLNPEETHTHTHTSKFIQALKGEDQVQNYSTDGEAKQCGTTLTETHGAQWFKDFSILATA